MRLVVICSLSLSFSLPLASTPLFDSSFLSVCVCVCISIPECLYSSKRFIISLCKVENSICSNKLHIAVLNLSLSLSFIPFLLRRFINSVHVNVVYEFSERERERERERE